MIKKTLIFFAFALLGASGYLGYKRYLVENEPKYKTETIQRGYIAQKVSANGTLNPVSIVSVGTQVSGTVKRLYVDYNSRVKEGDALLELDDSLYKAQTSQSEANVQKAKSALALAASNSKRGAELYKKEYISKQDYEQLLDAEKSALATLQNAIAANKKDLVNLGYTIIKSPVSGIVVDKQIDVGQTVAASFQTPTLIKIARDLIKMQIDTAFAEADIGKIKSGQRVSFSVDAFPGRTFEGVVNLIRLNPTVSQNVVTYNVVVSVENRDEKLLPGMTAFVSITTDEKKDSVLIPNGALRFSPKDKSEDEQNTKKRKSQNSATIYTLQEGEMRAVNVTLGITDNRYTELIGGDIKEGDTVIIGELLENRGSTSSKFRLKML